MKSIEDLQKNQKGCINKFIYNNQLERESKWSESIAVGSEDFVTRIKDRLNVRAKTRRIVKTEDDFILSEKEFSNQNI